MGKQDKEGAEEKERMYLHSQWEKALLLQERFHYVKAYFVFLSFLDYIIAWLQPSHTIL